VPATDIPIVCIGLNYRNHANEASVGPALALRREQIVNSRQLPIPAAPPMWYKPCASLAEPESAIEIPFQAQKSFPDFEVCLGRAMDV
jgi:2-keto-4-pentenoate hydratase/2-oxohepta-3-ene-1,7-dioic acid hydratase in catechol pathway